jgi:hypothetical protein
MLAGKQPVNADAAQQTLTRETVLFRHIDSVTHGSGSCAPAHGSGCWLLRTGARFRLLALAHRHVAARPHRSGALASAAAAKCGQRKRFKQT